MPTEGKETFFSPVNCILSHCDGGQTWPKACATTVLSIFLEQFSIMRQTAVGSVASDSIHTLHYFIWNGIVQIGYDG